MNTISYLKNIYGYGTPILLKDIRIGRKSKAAIKQELYLATKRGDIKRKYNGVYYFSNDDVEIPLGISFESVLEKKFIADNWGVEGFEIFNTYGYYSGLTFINMIGLSEQVPAIIEITTNKTSCNKRIYTQKGTPLKAIIRKSKIEITGQNYKMLQFLEMFYYLTNEEVIKGRAIITNYIKKCGFTKHDLDKYMDALSFEVFEKLAMGGLLNVFI